MCICLGVVAYRRNAIWCCQFWLDVTYDDCSSVCVEVNFLQKHQITGLVINEVMICRRERESLVNYCRTNPLIETARPAAIDLIITSRVMWHVLSIVNIIRWSCWIRYTCFVVCVFSEWSSGGGQDRHQRSSPSSRRWAATRRHAAG